MCCARRTGSEGQGFGLFRGYRRVGLLLWGPGPLGLQRVPTLSAARGCRERLVLASSNFQAWGQAQKSEVAVPLHRVTGLLSTGCRKANGSGLTLSQTIFILFKLYTILFFLD